MIHVHPKCVSHEKYVEIILIAAAISLELWQYKHEMYP